MPVRVNDFVIQAMFQEEETVSDSEPPISSSDLLALKNEIIQECMEKMEILMEKKEGR